MMHCKSVENARDTLSSAAIITGNIITTTHHYYYYDDDDSYRSSKGFYPCHFATG